MCVVSLLIVSLKKILRTCKYLLIPVFNIWLKLRHHDQGDKYKNGHTVDLFITCVGINFSPPLANSGLTINPAPVVEERSWSIGENQVQGDGISAIIDSWTTY